MIPRSLARSHILRMIAWIAVLFWMTAPRPVGAGVCIGDCNSSGFLEIDDVEPLAAAIFEGDTTCEFADISRDGTVSAADVVAEILAIRIQACGEPPTPTPTLTITETPTATETPTPDGEPKSYH